MSNAPREAHDPGAAGIAAIEVAVLGYGLIGSLDLLKAWNHSPIERFGWMALMVWLLPVVWLRARGPATSGSEPARPVLLGLSVGLVFLGGVGSLNVLQHWGLVFAVMAITPVGGACLVWLVAAVSWMPLLGWFLKSLPVEVIPLVRLGIAGTGMLALALHDRRGGG